MAVPASFLVPWLHDIKNPFLKVNDLYESKNLYMVVDNLCSLGGCAQKLGFDGPALGAKQSTANKRQGPVV